MKPDLRLLRLSRRAAARTGVAIFLFAAGLLGPTAIAAAAPPPLPTPAATPTVAATPPQGGGGSTVAADPRRGIVSVERDGRVVGVGTVLGGDGRVITALSALGGADQADVRFADGTLVNARVGHADMAWDLVLLVPVSGKWTDGLRASEADPATVEVRTFLPAKSKPTVVVAKVRGRTEARAKNGDALPSALDVEVHSPAPMPGAPLVDASGTVLGVLVRACKATDAGPCTPSIVGAPVWALRNFLLKTPATAVAPAPFLGIVGALEPATSAVKGVRVVAVAPASPAEKGALKPNSDVIVAVDGQVVDTPEKLAALIARHAVGDTVKLLVFGGDKLREVAVALRAAP